VTRTRWVQVLLGINLVSLLPLAIWPLVSPRGFYENFPGGGFHWIDINGPFNEHFLRDFGALNAALVVVIVAALWKPSAALLQAVGLALAVYALPHAIYHLSHLDVYKSSEKFVATAPLVLQFFMGLAIAWFSASNANTARA
jgi:hypothetical protein